MRRMRSTSSMKPEVEHLVGLVEHDVARRREVQGAARDQVQRPAHRGHDHVGTRAEPRLLGLDGLAAEHGDHLDRQVLGVGAKRLRHLDAELSGRRQDERLGVAGAWIEVLEHRQPEGGGLAGAGLRLADHVVTGEQLRDRLLLDRRRLGVAELVKGLEDRVREPELAKGGHWRCHHDSDRGAACRGFAARRCPRGRAAPPTAGRRRRSRPRAPWRPRPRAARRSPREAPAGGRTGGPARSRRRRGWFASGRRCEPSTGSREASP